MTPGEVVIVAPGPLPTVQDLGRPGLAALGVGPSGAADRRSLRLANRLVGNPEGAATVEITFGGFRARFTRAAVVALTGAEGPVRVADREVAANGPLVVPAGYEVVVGTPERGLRTYLAVRGGLAVPRVLGSRSTDLLSEIGPAPLRAGDRLPVGDEVTGDPVVDLAPVRALPETLDLDLLPGPRDDWFTAEAHALLGEATFEVTPRSNRVGLRLAGPALARAVTDELPSEGVVRGALQVPADGQPVLFLADHPVTGGYPVIGVVDERSADLAGQARPGQRVRFRVHRGLVRD